MVGWQKKMEKEKTCCSMANRAEEYMTYKHEMDAHSVVRNSTFPEQQVGDLILSSACQRSVRTDGVSLGACIRGNFHPRPLPSPPPFGGKCHRVEVQASRSLLPSLSTGWAGRSLM